MHDPCCNLPWHLCIVQVGYSVRLESKASGRTRILFCTVGVLLRRLMSDPDLALPPQPPSHILVDEVHERSLDTDLLLLLLRRLLERQQAGMGRRGPGIKVVLMSATISKSTFVEYFEGAGARVAQVELQGFSHPVADLYLEDALEITGVRIGRKGKYPHARPPPAAAQAVAGRRDHTEQEAGSVAGAEGGKGPGEGKEGEEEDGEGGGVEDGIEEEDVDGLAEDGEGPEGEESKGLEGGSEDSDEDWEALAEEGAVPGPLQGKQGEQQQGPSLRAGRVDGAPSSALLKTPVPPHPGCAALTAKDLSGYSEETVTSLQNASEEVINYELLVALVRCVVHGIYARPSPRASRRRGELADLLQEHVGAQEGDAPRGLLVFLPGQAEIGRVQRELAQRAEDRGAMITLALHSALSGEEQQKVFQRPPPGRWKVVLATNIAETSVTIEDIV